MPSVDDERPGPELERAVGEAISPTPQRNVRLDGSRLTAMILTEQRHETETLKVSTRSRASAVAGAIAGVMRERGKVDVQAIGAGATNQAIKAIAIAQSYLRDDGIQVCCIPSFINVMIDGQERTALRLFVEQRPQ